MKKLLCHASLSISMKRVTVNLMNKYVRSLQNSTSDGCIRRTRGWIFLRFVILGVALEFSFAACSQVQIDATEQYPLMYSEAGFINLLVRLVCPR